MCDTVVEFSVCVQNASPTHSSPTFTPRDDTSSEDTATSYTQRQDTMVLQMNSTTLSPRIISYLLSDKCLHKVILLQEHKMVVIYTRVWCGNVTPC